MPDATWLRLLIPRRNAEADTRTPRMATQSNSRLQRYIQTEAVDTVPSPQAHYGALLADGISGPLIIHSPQDPLVRGRDFDTDQIIFMNDWYHDPSTTIARKLLSTKGYNGTLAAPSPNSGMLVMQPDVLKQTVLPQANQGLCPKLGSN
ncbi:hypothetical protein PtA15_14A469 [Puccinia triticina]|uniref:Uncharacterized protein n=1 Tax=Puccinia triticina TaxID=208348 RepID=A0ABY7D2X8_9BASI|nr:uncharacterized protein PtA15_14A469 [Puccinia triticina]WAQ91585.1 hypothetical protein PtA15_14A469 [Puccinia triticina]